MCALVKIAGTIPCTALKPRKVTDQSKPLDPCRSSTLNTSGVQRLARQCIYTPGSSEPAGWGVAQNDCFVDAAVDPLDFTDLAQVSCYTTGHGAEDVDLSQLL